MTLGMSRKQSLEVTAPLFLRNCLHDLARSALAASMAAMDRGDPDTAMEHLETGLQARLDRLSLVVGGHAPFLDWLDPDYVTAAAVTGREDLIKLAAEAENMEADTWRTGGHAMPAAPSFEDTVLRSDPEERNREDARTAPVVHTQRRDQLLQLIDRAHSFQAIRDIVAAEPGIRQSDLAERLTAETRETALMVSQLEAAGQVAAAKEGSRVTVWPAGHPGTPASLRKGKHPWMFTGLTDRNELPAAEEEALTRLAWAKGLVDLIRGALGRQEDPESLKVLDFLMWPMDAMDAEGHLCNVDPDARELIMWGHVQPETPARILARYLEKNPYAVTTKKDRDRWARQKPRHTWLLPVTHDSSARVPRTLRETASPEAGTIPATVLEDVANAMPLRLSPRITLWLQEHD